MNEKAAVMATTLIKGLNRTQAAKFRKILEAKADEIRENLQSLKRKGALEVGEQTANLEDLACLSHEEWVFLNRNSIDVMLLREIQDSLQRIEDGAYGVCLECDEAISTKRLQAIPWARYCIACQEEMAALQEEDAARAAARR